MKPKRKRNRLASTSLDVLCWSVLWLYNLLSIVDERQHAGKKWESTRVCPHCYHGTPESSNYCVNCGVCVNVSSILALAAPAQRSPQTAVSRPLPALRMPKSHSAVLRALTAAGSPAYDASHSHPRLLAASVLYPGDTANVSRNSGKLGASWQVERDTPRPGTLRVWKYDSE